MSFAGLGFLALYLAGKMHLYDRRGHRVSYCSGSLMRVRHELIAQTRAWFALTPLLGGAMVAISRTEDNRRKLPLPIKANLS